MSKHHVVEANDQTFDLEVLRADLPVLVDFGATWCPPCRALEPIVERVAADHLGRYKVVSVNIDEAPVIAKRYGIRGAPTLLVFRDGEPTARHLGMTTRENLLRLLQEE